MQIFKMATKNGRKTIFGKTWHMTVKTVWLKTFTEIALYHTVSEINVFYTEIKMATKNGGKTIFGKVLDDSAYSLLAINFVEN